MNKPEVMVIASREPLISSDGQMVKIELATDRGGTFAAILDLATFKKVAAQFEMTARAADALASGRTNPDRLLCAISPQTVDVHVIQDVPGATLAVPVSDTVQYLMSLGPKLVAELVSNLQKAQRTQIPHQGKPS
ncbi:hypothetical protein CO683_00915 [Bradyrhizobium ottawaense]|uniref:hypothetical protein n=1 Tax=Bradyrhizobium ottawaense TaxID=931866 RepID=UPI000BE87406|nr:hypothetical protein [Bradyrhizobium ottawaense]PDT71752.1 hypothetical protein CO683_00915 [Bradyrhizobium ottawaense]